MSFYNTTSETGPSLAKAHKQCSRQEKYLIKLMIECDPDNKGLTSDEVNTIVRQRKQRTFYGELQKLTEADTPFELLYQFIEDHYVRLQHTLISIRRAMTDLCSDDIGILEMTNQKRTATSGRKNCVYRRKKQ